MDKPCMACKGGEWLPGSAGGAVRWSPDGAGLANWSSLHVILHCGVRKPALYTPNPTWLQGVHWGGVGEGQIDDPEKSHGLCVNDAKRDGLVIVGWLRERHFGPGRDMEWGIESNILYLLQCRTITTGMPG